MKTIMANFRRVTRYGVAVFLAAATCFSAFAEITCTPGEPYKQGTQWYVDVYCHGDIDPVYTTVPIDADPGSGGGTCTNCTAMTPSDCQAVRDSLISSSDDLDFDISDTYDYIDNVYYLVDDLSMSVDTIRTLGDIYFSEEENFNGEVIPVLNMIDSQIFGIYDGLDSSLSCLSSLSTYPTTIRGVAEGMNCSVCQSPGGSGGGGGGGGGGGTTPSGCPCSEYINAVKTAVENCHTKLSDISSKVSSIKTRLDEWDELLKQIKNDVHAIRQTTDRMDDFFKDDTDVNFKKLIEHVLVLSNAVFKSELKLPQNLYWTEYTNATQFTDDNGTSIDWLQKGKTIEAGADGAVIDFGEYKTLNWFQRMEFLLGHIAGIFSPTNSANADFDEDQKEQANDAQDVFDGLTFDDEKSVLNQMVEYVENIEDSLNPFHGIFDYSSGSTRSITFLPDVSVENDLLGNTMPTITMDLTETGDGSFSISDLVDLAHNLTTFLWLVSFLIIDVLAIIKFVQCLIALNRWYWKIYNSWVGTMFNGAGR